MFRRKQNPTTPYSWSDPLPLPPPVLPSSHGTELPNTTPPNIATQPHAQLHPLTQMFFRSSVLLGIKSFALTSIGLSAGTFLWQHSTENVLTVNLLLATVVFGLLGLSGLLQLLAMNVSAARAVTNAWRETRAGKDLDGSGAVGDVNLTPGGERRGAVERVIDLIPSNRSGRSVIESGAVRIDKRDLLQFLHRAWETNGKPEQGTARLYWTGGRKQDGTLAPQYIFKRNDDSEQICTREYYDAIMAKLESINEVELRMPGSSGKLRRAPIEWLSQTAWM